MSQRRQSGEWVLVTLPGNPIPQPALIQPSTNEPDPCFTCDDGGCCEWPVLLHTSDSRRSGLRTASECQMQNVPKSFSGLLTSSSSCV